jgi:hypothetical protein
MDLTDLEKRAAEAVAQMNDAAVQRIAEADPSSVVIALSSDQNPDEEAITTLRRLVHDLCKARARRNTSMTG